MQPIYPKHPTLSNQHPMDHPTTWNPPAFKVDLLVMQFCTWTIFWADNAKHSLTNWLNTFACTLWFFFNHKLHNIFVYCIARVSLHCRAIITEAVNIISTRNGRIKGIHNIKSSFLLKIVNWYGLRGLVIAWWFEKEGEGWIGPIWACPVCL